MGPLATGVGGGGLRLLEEYIVPSNLQTYDFMPTLDGNNSKGWLLRFSILNGSGSNAGLKLRVNEADVSWERQYVIQSSSTNSAARDTTAQLTTSDTAEMLDGWVEIIRPRGESGVKRYAHFFTSYFSGSGGVTNRIQGTCEILTPAVTTNITKLGFGMTVAAALSAKSILQLWEYK